MMKFKPWTEKDKAALIDTIEWYRDKYFKSTTGDTICNEYIRLVNKTSDPDLLEWYDRIVDGWIDY